MGEHTYRFALLITRKPATHLFFYYISAYL